MKRDGQWTFRWHNLFHLSPRRPTTRPALIYCIRATAVVLWNWRGEGGHHKKTYIYIISSSYRVDLPNVLHCVNTEGPTCSAASGTSCSCSSHRRVMIHNVRWLLLLALVFVPLWGECCSVWGETQWGACGVLWCATPSQQALSSTGFLCAAAPPVEISGYCCGSNTQITQR